MNELEMRGLKSLIQDMCDDAVQTALEKLREGILAPMVDSIKRDVDGSMYEVYTEIQNRVSELIRLLEMNHGFTPTAEIEIDRLGTSGVLEHGQFVDPSDGKAVTANEYARKHGLETSRPWETDHDDSEGATPQVPDEGSGPEDAGEGEDE